MNNDKNVIEAEVVNMEAAKKAAAQTGESIKKHIKEMFPLFNNSTALLAGLVITVSTVSVVNLGCKADRLAEQAAVQQKQLAQQASQLVAMSAAAAAAQQRLAAVEAKKSSTWWWPFGEKQQETK